MTVWRMAHIEPHTLFFKYIFFYYQYLQWSLKRQHDWALPRCEQCVLVQYLLPQGGTQVYSPWPCRQGDKAAFFGMHSMWGYNEACLITSIYRWSHGEMNKQVHKEYFTDQNTCLVYLTVSHSRPES